MLDILMAEGIMPRPLQANDDVEDGPEDPEDIVMEVQPGEGEPSRKRLFHEDDDDDVVSRDVALTLMLRSGELTRLISVSMKTKRWNVPQPRLPSA